MSRPLLLLPSPVHEVVSDGIEGRFDTLRLWEADDADTALAERAGEVLAVVGGGKIDAAFLDRLPNLQLVAATGVGYEHIDATAAAERGVVVTHTPGVLDDEVADTAMGLLLMATRQLSGAERFVRAGHWRDRSFPLTPATLHGRRMGILGLGRIGEAVARRATPFGISIGYHNRHRKDVPYDYYPTLLELAGASDILMVVIPGGAETKHLVDAEVLRALGPDGILVNVARGSVVDEAALADALRDGTILGAGLDVFEHEPEVHPGLLELDNAVLLPHIGSATVPTRNAMSRLVVDNLLSWFDSGTPVTPVPESAPLLRRTGD